jgi:hypothetical protein
MSNALPSPECGMCFELVFSVDVWKDFLLSREGWEGHVIEKAISRLNHSIEEYLAHHDRNHRRPNTVVIRTRKGIHRITK